MLFIQDCLLNGLLITHIHWKWQWLLAAIFLVDEQSALSTLATDFFSSLRNCIGVLESKKVPGCHAGAVPQEMAAQVLLLPILPVWSLAGDLGLDSSKDGGSLHPSRAPFQLLLTCHLPSAPHVRTGRSPSASSSAAGHATKCLSAG